MARLTLRLPDDLYERLCAVSRKQGFSLNQVITEALDQQLPPLPAPVPEHETPQERERRLLRAWIAESHPNDDFSRLRPALRPENAPKDRDAFLASLPASEQSAAQLISEERDSYGY